MEIKPTLIGLSVLLISEILTFATLSTCGGIGVAEIAVDFPGTVLKVDDAARKLTVKKDGTRFTFVVDGRTQYTGTKALKELKTGDMVTVTYVVIGSQYVAQRVSKSK
jgi:hypothetical protein